MYRNLIHFSASLVIFFSVSVRLVSKTLLAYFFITLSQFIYILLQKIIHFKDEIVFIFRLLRYHHHIPSCFLSFRPMRTIKRPKTLFFLNFLKYGKTSAFFPSFKEPTQKG